MVNALLCSLASRLPADRLQLYLCDLKGRHGVSFLRGTVARRAIHHPHAGVASDAGRSAAELERRSKLLKGNARDLDGYNYQMSRARALPYIVVVIDEIANAMLCKDKIVLGEARTTVAAATESILADLAARARTVGIRLVVSTQRPSIDVVTVLIKANSPCRIAFGAASEVDSRLIIDDGSAHGAPSGRMRYRRNMELLELQAPFLSDEDVRRQVKQIIADSSGVSPASETEEDRARKEIAILLKIAEQSFGRRFPIRELAAHATTMQHNISRYRVETYASRLEKEGILRRGIGPRPRSIQKPSTHWKALYPPGFQYPIHNQMTSSPPSVEADIEEISEEITV